MKLSTALIYILEPLEPNEMHFSNYVFSQLQKKLLIFQDFFYYCRKNAMIFKILFSICRKKLRNFNIFLFAGSTLFRLDIRILNFSKIKFPTFGKIYTIS